MRFVLNEKGEALECQSIDFCKEHYESNDDDAEERIADALLSTIVETGMCEGCSHFIPEIDIIVSHEAIEEGLRRMKTD